VLKTFRAARRYQKQCQITVSWVCCRQKKNPKFKLKLKGFLFIITQFFRTWAFFILKFQYHYFFLFYLDYETIGTAATPGLLCQPQVIMKMIVESMMKCRLAGETEVLGENLPRRHFCPSRNPTCPPGFEPGPPRWEAGD
jgi:hypothetical protein